MMPLVDYSSSEEDEIQHQCEENKIKLPNMIRNIQFGRPTIEELSAAASSHDGRVRSFAHERGNWATYLYIDCKFAENDTINALQNRLNQYAANKLNLSFRQFDAVHISLTRTLVLRHHWIELFVKAINSSLVDIRKYIYKLMTFY